MRLKISLAAAALALAAVAQQPSSGAGGGEIAVTASKYKFEPSTIMVKKGEHVRLVITAMDHDHGFKLEAFHVEQKLKKGEPATIEFTPTEAGTFPFQCSHFCGPGHRGMKGQLVVE